VDVPVLITEQRWHL